MPGTTRILKDPWPFRSTTPGASDSFDIDGLQGVLRQLDEHVRWTQAATPDTPAEGDLWSDTSTGVLRLYGSGTWRTLGLLADDGRGTAFDLRAFGSPAAGNDWTVPLLAAKAAAEAVGGVLLIPPSPDIYYCAETLHFASPLTIMARGAQIEHAGTAGAPFCIFGTATSADDGTWVPPTLAPGASATRDVTVKGARPGNAAAVKTSFTPVVGGVPYVPAAGQFGFPATAAIVAVDTVRVTLTNPADAAGDAVFTGPFAGTLVVIAYGPGASGGAVKALVVEGGQWRANHAVRGGTHAVWHLQGIWESYFRPERIVCGDAGADAARHFAAHGIVIQGRQGASTYSNNIVGPHCFGSTTAAIYAAAQDPLTGMNHASIQVFTGAHLTYHDGRGIHIRSGHAVVQGARIERCGAEGICLEAATESCSFLGVRMEACFAGPDLANEWHDGPFITADPSRYPAQHTFVGQMTTLKGITPDTRRAFASLTEGYAGVEWHGRDTQALGEVRGRSVAAERSVSTPYAGLGRGANLVKWGEAFGNAAWQKANTGGGTPPTVAANVGPDPLGGATADRVDFADVVNSYLLQNSGVDGHGQTYTFSAWLATAPPGGVGPQPAMGTTRLDLYSSGFLNHSKQFTIDATPRRYSLTYAVPSGETGPLSVRIFHGSGDDLSVYAWGAQLEQAEAPGAYVRTQALARAAPMPGLILGEGTAAWVGSGDTYGRAMLDSRNRPVLVEEFIGGTATSGSVGSLGWSLGYAAGAAGGGLSIQTDLGHPGMRRLDSGATAGTVYCLYLGAFVSWAIDEQVDLRVWFRPGAFDADTLLRIGYSNGPTTNPPLTGAWLEKLYADTAFWYVSSAAGAQTRVTSGVTADGAWHVFRVRRSAETGTDTLYFSLDDGAEAQVTTNKPTGGNNGIVSFQVGTQAAAAKACDFDRVELAFGGLTR